MDLIAGYSLPNGLLNMNYKTRNRAGQPVQPSTDTITNAITQGLLPMLASAGIGTGAGIVGQFGEAENLGKLAINKLGGNVNPNTTLPTQEGILSYLNSITPLKPYTDNTYTKIGANLLAPILDPTALITTAKATKNMPIGNMIAYHGTPHEIKGGFDISKVGTGEGAQAYGHGMYFAENQGVAKQYQKDLSNYYEPYVQYGKDKIAGQGLSDTDLNVFKYLEIGKKQAGEFPHNTQYYAKKIAEEAGDLEALKKLQEHSDIKFGEQFNTGNLYKVDIPDKDIPYMLDWDKPLSQQPKAVQEALAKYNPDLYSPKGMDYDPNERGQWIYMRLAGDTTQKNASNKLNEFGIKGIKYNDAGSRTTEGGTSNFVVFDPKEVKILEKNNKSIEPTITVNDRNIPVTLHPVEERQGHKIEFVNTNKFENAFKKDETGYIGPLGTENAIKNRYKGVEEFLKTAPSMRASEAYVKPNGSVVFGDGRHRFAYLRDQGLDKIPISMDKESIKNAKKYGYID